MENKNEISVFGQTIANTYCSIATESKEEQVKLYNALESCDALLNDCEGTVINLKDIYCEQKEVVDDKTGEVRTKYRTILFDESGKTYATGAYGIFNSIKKIINIWGLPTTWEQPIKVKVAKKNIGNGKQSLTLLLED